jgi:hypothetical protein
VGSPANNVQSSAVRRRLRGLAMDRMKGLTKGRVGGIRLRKEVYKICELASMDCDKKALPFLIRFCQDLELSRLRVPRHIDEHGARENCVRSAIDLHTAGEQFYQIEVKNV